MADRWMISTLANLDMRLISRKLPQIAAGHRTHELTRVCGIVLMIAAGAVTLGGVQGPQSARPWPPAVAPLNTGAPVLSPTEALRTFAMPPGYRLELVASEPLIQDPIAIDWDPAGRLWAIELPGYMRDIKASGEYDPIARIVVLEDANGDGAMDRRTVFADGLIQPRAMKVLEQGVLVGEPPNVWLMRDTDGDLRSDRKELVAAGYGRRETNVEVNANALLWGLDNRIHMAGTGADMVLRFSDRTFQVQKSLSRGQWGATQDDAGRVYRNHNESVLHVDLVPTPYFARNPALLRTRGSHEPLRDPDGNINDVWPAHQTPGTNRAYQHGILRDERHARRRSPPHARPPFIAAIGCRPSCTATSSSPSRPRTSSAGSCCPTTARRCGREKAYRAGRVPDARRTSGSGRCISRTLPTARSTSSIIYRGVIQHHAYITEYLRDQIASRALEQPIGLGRIYRVVHDTHHARSHDGCGDGRVRRSWSAVLSHPNGWWRDTAQRLLVERGDRSVAAGAGQARWRPPRTGGPASTRCGRSTD